MATLTPVNDLTTILRDIGRASVWYGTGAYAGSGTAVSMTQLGDTEGEISVDFDEKYSELTVPELTGDIPWQKYLESAKPTIKIPMALVSLASRAIVSPTGTAHGGFDRRQAVTEYYLALIPTAFYREGNADVAFAYTQAADWTVNGDTATAAQLAIMDKSIWLWRGHFSKPGRKFRHEDGGKEITEVMFHPMYNTAMPQGQKIFTLGRPDQATPAVELDAS